MYIMFPVFSFRVKSSFSPFEKFTPKLGTNLFTGQMSSSKNKKNNIILLVKWQNIYFPFFSKAV